MNILDEANRLASSLADEFRKTMIRETRDNSSTPTGTPRTIVAYSGQFQPFHEGHFKIYQVLVKKFGKDNTYITTTNQINETEGPLSFQDKKQVIIQMFDIDPNKVEEVKNSIVPTELLREYDSSKTAFITVIDAENIPIIHKSKYFHRYVDGELLRPFKEAGYYLTVPELRAPVGHQALTGPQIMQVLGSPKTSVEVKTKLFKAVFGKNNAQIQNLISSKAKASAEAIDGEFEKSKARGQTNNPTPVQSTAHGQDNADGDVADNDKIPPMKRMITNPDTGREIKVQSALKYPRWKPVYKKAEHVLKSAGIDRNDRVKEPEVNARYKKRAKKNLSNEDWTAYIGNLLSDDIQNIITELNLGELGDDSPSLGGSGTKPVAIYAGRFQPFHTGHYHAYQNLVNKFGKDNVYIATSDKTNSENSPFDFNDKQKIITTMFDINPTHVVQVKSPYQAEEIVSKLRPDTPIVFALGTKDADRLAGSAKFKPYQDGQLSRFDPQGGYIYKVPQLPMEINGETISGTGVRNVFATGSPSDKKALFTALYGKFDQPTFDLITNRATNGPINPAPVKAPKAPKQPGAPKFSKLTPADLNRTVKNPETDNDIKIKTALQYDDSHPAKKAAINLLKQSIISNGLMLTESAPDSHVMHPYDDPTLRFGDLKDMIHQSLLGDFGSQATEKYDGQTLLFTIRKDGKVVFARNTQHTKDYGQNAMTADEYETFFSNHGEKIPKVFAQAARDVTNAVSKIPLEEQARIFAGGKNFVLSELLSSELPNTIPYGTNRVVMLNIREYDPTTGNPTSAPIDRFAADALVSDINKYADPNAGTFKISGNTKLQFDNSKASKYTQKEHEYFGELAKMQSEAHADDSMPIGTYFEKQWNDILDQTKLPWTPEERAALLRRWVYGDKSFGSKHIQDPTKKETFRKIDADYKKHLAHIVSPIKTMILKVGADAVERATNVVSKNDGTKERLQAALKSALQAIRDSDDPTFIEKARDQMEQLKKLGGEDSISPSEGLIIQHNGRLYKLTGSFAPINQIVGIHRYKLAPETRDKSEPETLSLQAPKQPDNLPNKKYADLMNRTVKNPETDNEILVKTALGYDENHPAHKAALKLLQTSETLSEGGHAVDASSKIPNQFAVSTANHAAKALGLDGIERALVGSTHKPLMNDLDVATDRDAVRRAVGYMGTDKKEFFAHLQQYLQQKGITATMSPGFEQFSVAVPLVNDQGQPQDGIDEHGQSTGQPGHVQADFMMGNLPWMKKYLTNGDQSDVSSTYRNVLVADALGKMIFPSKDDPNVKWKYQINTRDGVEKITFTEKPNGKRDVLNKQSVSSNPDDLSKILFGPKATFADMNTFEKLNQKIQSSDFQYPQHRSQIYKTFTDSITRMKKELPPGIPQTTDTDTQQQKVTGASEPEHGSNSALLNTKIKNPETDNDILIKTALNYDDSQPVKKAALNVIQSKRGSK